MSPKIEEKIAMRGVQPLALRSRQSFSLARAAALFKKPSQALEGGDQPGSLRGDHRARFIEMQGPLPVVVDDEVIGAIGASFATPRKTNRLPRQDLPASGRERKATRRLGSRGRKAGALRIFT